MIYWQQQLSERGWSAEPGRGEFELSFWRIISCPVSSSLVMQKIAILPKICQHVSALLMGLHSLFISPCWLHNRCWGMQYGTESPHKEKSTVNSVCVRMRVCPGQNSSHSFNLMNDLLWRTLSGPSHLIKQLSQGALTLTTTSTNFLCLE